MHRRTGQYLLATFLAAHLAFGAASAAMVGMAVSSGEFTVDDARMPGVATVFDGSRIQTGRASSRIQLQDGPRIQLGRETSGVLHRDRMVLERGWTRMDDLGGYRLEAMSLRIHGSAGAGVQVTVGPERVLQVAALRGPVQVFKNSGMLLANVAAGSALAFSPQAAGAVAASRITGCLESEAQRHFVGDETSRVRFEVLGQDVAAHLGKRVEVVGIAEADDGGAGRVTATSIRPLPGKCATRSALGAGAAGASAAKGGSESASGAGAAGAPGPASGAAAAAAGGITTKAVIAGVIVAGVVAGAAVAATADEPAAISPSRP